MSGGFLGTGKSPVVNLMALSALSEQLEQIVAHRESTFGILCLSAHYEDLAVKEINGRIGNASLAANVRSASLKAMRSTALGPEVSSLLCRGQERCTMRQKVSQIRNPELVDMDAYCEGFRCGLLTIIGASYIRAAISSG